MVRKLGLDKTIRYIEIVLVFLILSSFAGAGYALYDRFSQSNVRFKDQQVFNYRIDHAADRLNCSIRKMIVQAGTALDSPTKPTWLLYVRLGFTMKQIQAAEKFLHENEAAQLASLPPANCP